MPSPDNSYKKATQMRAVPKDTGHHAFSDLEMFRKHDTLITIKPNDLRFSPCVPLPNG